LKKLNKLVIKSFFAPFAATFFVVLFMLLMQFLWKYIDDLVGKGLEWYVIAELLFYATATLVPLALPLAILVSSIMTFGNLAENYEIVAAKSAGISLHRILRPMIVVAILISSCAFLFSNYMLPYTNLKMGSLLYDVRQQKPAFYIREGVFYNGIDGYSIKVGSKGQDNSTLKDIMIYDHSAMNGNTKVVVARKGSMKMSDDEKFLLVSLDEGNSYDEQARSKNAPGQPSTQLLRSSFDHYEFRFDLSSFKLARTNEELFKDNFQMLNLSQLSSSLDSFQTEMNKRVNESAESGKSYLMSFREGLMNDNSVEFDSVKWIKIYPIISGNNSNIVYDNAMGQSRNMKSYFSSIAEELDSRHELMARFSIEWHRKFTLSIACFILFLIGAPLGAIIRKGGIGLPVVVSVGFFLFFHIISITGEKFVREGVLDPWIGMWLASAILLPIGITLLVKAANESVIFDVDYYVKGFKRLFKLKQS
jgi:lipopolysaccharide export system permease protein